MSETAVSVAAAIAAEDVDATLPGAVGSRAYDFGWEALRARHDTLLGA